MPITIKFDTDDRVGLVTSVLAGFATDLDGTHEQPGSFAGSMNATLGGFVASLDGQFGSATSRDGDVTLVLGGFSADLDGAFTAPLDPDVTAPPVPTGLASIQETATTIALQWNASVDVQGAPGEEVSGTASYTLYRNGAPVVTQAGLSYVDSGLTPETAYSYQILATDAAGNSSALSSEVNVSTTAAAVEEAWNPPTPPAEVYTNTVTKGINDSFVDALNTINANASDPSNRRGTMYLESGTHLLSWSGEGNKTPVYNDWEWLNIECLDPVNRAKLKMTENQADDFGLFGMAKTNTSATRGFSLKNVIVEGSTGISFGAGQQYNMTLTLIIDNCDIGGALGRGIIYSPEWKSDRDPITQYYTRSVTTSSGEQNISTGTATGADSSTTLIDSAGVFATDGVRPGDLVRNLTDGSTAEVRARNSFQQLTTFDLTGGADNLYQAGDSYQIIRTGSVLTDTSGKFTAADGPAPDNRLVSLGDKNLTAGDTVVNNTDGSTATVLEVVSDTVLHTTKLEGGTNNVYQAGDSYTLAVLGDSTDKRGIFSPYNNDRRDLPVDDTLWVRNSAFHHCGNGGTHQMYVDRIAKAVFLNSDWYSPKTAGGLHSFKCEAREIHIEGCRISNVALDGTLDTATFAGVSGPFASSTPVSMMATKGTIKNNTFIKAWPENGPFGDYGSAFIAFQGRHDTHSLELPDPKGLLQPVPYNEFYTQAFWDDEELWEVVCTNNHFLWGESLDSPAANNQTLYYTSGTWPVEQGLYFGRGLAMGNAAGDGPMPFEDYGWFERQRITCSGDTTENFLGLITNTGLDLYAAPTWCLGLGGENDLTEPNLFGRTTMNPTDNIAPNSTVNGYYSRYTVTTPPIELGGQPSWYPSSAGVIVQIDDGTTLGDSVRAAGGNSYGQPTLSWGTDPDDIVDPWSGGALCTISGSPYLVVYGGGHNDSAYNGIHKFGPLNSDTPTWSLFLAPSALGDLVNNSTTAADGRQSSNHTYNNLVGIDDELYCMATDASGQAPIASNEAFKFSQTGGQTSLATNPRLFAEGSQTGTLYGACAYYNGKIYYRGSNGAFDRLHIYNVSTNAWSTPSEPLDTFFRSSIAMAIDTARGALLIIGLPEGHYYDDVTAPARRTGIQVPPGYNHPGNDECALEYDPVRDTFVALGTSSLGGTNNVVYELDAAALAAGGSPAWTTRTFTGADLGSGNSIGTFGRFRYVPTLAGYVVLPGPGPDGGVYFMRST